MQNNFGKDTDLKVMINKPYLAKTFIGIMKDVKKAKTHSNRLVYGLGQETHFGRVGILCNKIDKKRGKWGQE